MASLPALPSMSRFVWQQVLSAFLPGALVIAELAWTVAPNATRTFLDHDMAGGASGVVLLVFVSSAYAVGVPCRAAGFWLLKLKEKPPALNAVVQQLENQFSRRTVRAAMKEVAWLKGAEETAETRLNGAFVYTKFWLRIHAPANSVDQLEVEINSRAALLLPLILSVLPVGRAVLDSDGPTSVRWVVAIGAVLSAFTLTWLLLIRTAAMRSEETLTTLQHFIATRHALGHGAPSSSASDSPKITKTTEPEELGEDPES